MAYKVAVITPGREQPVVQKFRQYPIAYEHALKAIDGRVVAGTEAVITTGRRDRMVRRLTRLDETTATQELPDGTLLVDNALGFLGPAQKDLGDPAITGDRREFAKRWANGQIEIARARAERPFFSGSGVE
jgi:hypothetical protein